MLGQNCLSHFVAHAAQCNAKLPDCEEQQQRLTPRLSATH